MPNVDTWMHKKITASKNNNCTLENAAIRREWWVNKGQKTSKSACC